MDKSVTNACKLYESETLYILTREGLDNNFREINKIRNYILVSMPRE